MGQKVFVVDDDEAMRQSLTWMLTGAGIEAESFASGEAFLAQHRREHRGCALLDVRMPRMDGLVVHRRLRDQGSLLPVVIMSGHADVPMAVEAMDSGALFFLEKPFTQEALLSAIGRAMRRAEEVVEADMQRRADEAMLGRLTAREREVMLLAVHGRASKVIATMLGISVRTVDKHREHILGKTGAGSWADLVALSVRLGLGEKGRGGEIVTGSRQSVVFGSASAARVGHESRLE